MIIDCEKKKEAAKQDVLTKENVFKMLLVFDKIFDKMNDVDKRKLIESMIAEVHLHPKGTWQEGKNPIKEIRYAFPVSQEVMEALRENVALVETVVKLSLKKDTPKIEVTMEPDEESNYTPEEKITYQKIKAYILEKYGFKVSSLYIAQIKDKCGLGKERTGNNWKKNDKSKEPQCTPEKEEAIRDAFKNFNII
mgnify:CR=1 FL=1